MFVKLTQASESDNEPVFMYTVPLLLAKLFDMLLWPITSASLYRG